MQKAASCLLLIASLLLSSCAKPQVVRKAEPEPYTGPVTIDVLKKSVGFGNVSSIKSLVDVSVFKDGEASGSLNGVLGYKAPSNMKVSMFGPFGLTVTELLMTSTVLQMHIPSKALLYEWKSSGISLSTLLDDHFIYAMEEKGDELYLYAFGDAEGGSGLFATYIFDRKYLLNRGIVFYRENKEAARISFGSFNGRVPEKTMVGFLNGSAMEITLREPEYDTDIPDGYFKQIPHADKKVLPFQDLLKRLAPKR